MDNIFESLILRESRKVLENMIAALDERGSSQFHTNSNIGIPYSNNAGVYLREVRNSQQSEIPSKCPQNAATINTKLTMGDLRVAENNLSKYTRDLFAWCPVKLEANGACCIAGLCKTSEPGKRCELVVSDELEAVSCSGKSVRTARGQRFRLQGSISWSTYCLLNPGTPSEKLPPELESAFSYGFPKANWRDSIRDMHAFSTGRTDLSINYTPKAKQLQSPTLCTKKKVHCNSTEQVDPYQSILESYNGCGNLHTLIDNAVLKAKRFLQLGDVQVNNEPSLNATPFMSEQTPSSSMPTPHVNLTALQSTTDMEHANLNRSPPSPSFSSFQSTTKYRTSAKTPNTQPASKPTTHSNKPARKKIPRLKIRARRFISKRSARTYQLRTESDEFYTTT